jgi:GntR family transcriptional regulator
MSVDRARVTGCTPRVRRRADTVRWVRDLIRLDLRDGGETVRVLPDERILAKQYGVSRNVVREVLNLLRAEGLVERRQGAGTLVVAVPAPLDSTSRAGMVNELADGPSRVRYEMLAIERTPASPTMGRRLGIDAGEPMAMLERLTYVDEKPVVVWTTHMRLLDGAKVAALDLGCDGIELIEQGTSTPIVRTEIRMEAVLADESVSELLNVDCGNPLLRLERTLFASDGRIVAISFGRLRSDQIGMVVLTDRHLTPG